MGVFNNKYSCIFTYKENTSRKFNILVHPINFYTCTIYTIIVETVCRVKQSLQSAKTLTGIHGIVFLSPLHWNQFSRCFPTYPIFLWVTRGKLFNIIFIYIYLLVIVDKFPKHCISAVTMQRWKGGIEEACEIVLFYTINEHDI
jgi:hypothetical protein